MNVIEIVQWMFSTRGKYLWLINGVGENLRYPIINLVYSNYRPKRTKQSDGEVRVMLELWGMRSTPSMPLLPGPLWPGIVVPDKALSMG